MNQRWKIAVGVMMVLAAAAGAAERPSERAQACRILEASGVRGGLVVVAGSPQATDDKLLCALANQGPMVVQGLSADADNIAAGRKQILSAGVSGKVSMIEFDGRHLPYIGGMVNLVVIKAGSQVSREEILRVLAPDGTAVFLSDDGKLTGEKVVKPRSADIDEWSHFLHDASGNAVAMDKRIGPPDSLHWVAGPRWSRSHEIPSSVQAVVTAGGRLFTIFDESPTGVYEKLPWDCKLVARDAANGVLLWKVSLQGWQMKSGAGFGGRWGIFHTIPRRLVASGDRVYVTLGFLDSPVSVLDAATGKVICKALDHTRGADEMILVDGVLIVKTSPKLSPGAIDRFGKERLDDTLVALDAKTGKLLWQKPDIRVVPYALSALDGRLVYHNMDELICLDVRTGERIWKADNVLKTDVGGGNTLVIADGVVLFNGPALAGVSNNRSIERGLPASKLFAYSLADGKPLWEAKGQRALAAACTQPVDVFVINGTVWCGNSLTGVDLHTGKPTVTKEIDNLISRGHHFRCYRAKATERYLIWPKRGAEFIDLVGDKSMRNDWTRGACFTGVTPANGLLYLPSNQCFCYPGVLVSGYLALASRDRAELEKLWQTGDEDSQHRLTKGPAYGSHAAGTSISAVGASGDWPMYRRDALRSGSTSTPVPDKPARLWQVKLACQGSQAVVVGGRLWVAEKDAQRIRCLDAADGKDLWSFVAGGRIDSAPTVYDGMVIFGSRDGSVYCLRADDGKLVWRFRAAPDSRQVMSFEQLESLWPVNGSVLVQDGVVYFAAGRSSFLDGGIVVFGLDAKTGQCRYRHHLDGPWPNVKTDAGSPFAMDGALPDLIVSDGKDLYMQRIKFDAHLKRLDPIRGSSLGELDMGANHLVATGGFLDDSGFDRLYWMYGRRWPGFYFAQQSPKSGQLVVFNDHTTYAVKYFYHRIVWSPAFIPADQGYLLFADDNDNEPALPKRGDHTQPLDWLPEGSTAGKYRRGGYGVDKGVGYVRVKPDKWQTLIPVRVRAMVLAGGRLCAAGMPDKVDAKDPLASFRGRDGAMLNVYSAADGALVSSLRLESVPAFDALSAAEGRLYLATTDGKLMCFGTKPAK